MSSRKRHSEFADFMRQYVLHERGKVWLWNFRGDPYIGGHWRRINELIDKAVKRGFLVRGRMGLWGNYVRRNTLKTTAKGRRFVYELDRHDPNGIKPPR